MAKRCEICGKGVSTGHNVSHSNHKSKRRWLPNVHKVRAIVDGTPKRITICTDCLRSGKVKRTI